MRSDLIKYLENELHFRDYLIKRKKDFGKFNRIAVHQMVDAESLEHDVNEALNKYSRDGFSLIVFYV